MRAGKINYRKKQNKILKSFPKVCINNIQNKAIDRAIDVDKSQVVFLGTRSTFFKEAEKRKLQLFNGSRLS